MDLATLPDEVKQLPDAAQVIWLALYESALRTWSGPDFEKQEAAGAAAWTAISSRYESVDDKWIARKSIAYDSGALIGECTFKGCKFVADAVDAKSRVVFGEVYRPWEIDAQGDFASPETIESAAHSFLERYRTIGEQHKFFGGKGHVVESFIARPGDEFFPEDSWAMGVKLSEDMWTKVTNGELNGFSLGGNWKRIPVVAGPEMLVKGGDKSATANSLPIELSVLEAPQYEGVRIISEIVDVVVKEVSPVTTPANRKPWAFFKGMDMKTSDKTAKAKVVGRKQEEEMAPGAEEQAMNGTPLDFQACVTAVDGMVGAGNGTPICHLMAAKWANPAAASDPEAPAIVVPPDLTMEQAVEECLEVASDVGLEVKSGVPSVLGKLLRTVKAIGKHVGLPVDGETKEEDEPMTTEERKELDELKSTVGDIKGKLDGIGDEVTAAVTKALATKGKDDDDEKDGKKPKKAASDDEKDASGKDVAGDEEEDDVDEVTIEDAILDIVDEVKSIGDRITAMETGKLSDQSPFSVVDGGKGDEAEDGGGGGFTRSTILGAPVSRSARKKLADSHAEQRKERGSRSGNPKLRFRGAGS